MAVERWLFLCVAGVGVLGGVRPLFPGLWCACGAPAVCQCAPHRRLHVPLSNRRCRHDHMRCAHAPLRGRWQWDMVVWPGQTSAVPPGRPTCSAMQRRADGAARSVPWMCSLLWIVGECEGPRRCLGGVGGSLQGAVGVQGGAGGPTQRPTQDAPVGPEVRAHDSCTMGSRFEPQDWVCSRGQTQFAVPAI